MKKIVFTIGVFDLLHEGHINLLERMRKEAGKDGLVACVVHDDESTWENKGKIPIQSLDRRMENLYTTGLVDMASETDNETIDFNIEMINSRSNSKIIYMRGDDWKDFPGRKTIEKLGIEIKFIKYTDNISSSKLKKWLTE